MDGPARLLVSQPSATSILPADASSAYSRSLRRNHSDLVKFSLHDTEYDRVADILKDMQEIPANYRTQERESQVPHVIREPLEGNSVTGQHRGSTGKAQVNNPAKRPADQTYPSLVGKRPRLASHLPESGHPQTGDDRALRNPLLSDEMRDIKQELISRLYFSKIDERLTHLTPAQGTTCRWFLTGSMYQSWQDVAQQSEHGGFLWIKGNPGTGKSTLMKFLFEQTIVNSKDDPSRITLSFFFLARGTAEEKTTMGLYRSLLHQLFELASDLKDSLDWMTVDGARTIRSNGWSEEALKQTLKYVIPKLGNRALTMFVDALDECDENKADDMVSFFEELCECATEARIQVHICFSSRYYPTVVIKNGIEVSLEDEIGHKEDIRKYVKSRLRLKAKSKPAEALRSEILQKSSGIFLWVVLVLDILNNDNSISVQRLRERLKEIPPKLNELFQMILSRDGDNLEQLQLCLNWVLFASRALKPQELYFAIQFGSDKECSGFWDQSDLDLDDMKTFVRNCSKGLAEVTRNKACEVQFIHESVKDFLLGKYGDQWSRTSGNLRGHGHHVLRDCCIAQLNASISQQVEIPDPLPPASQAAELRNTIDLKFPFLKYSVHNVLHHSNLAQRNELDQRPFLSEFPLQRWTTLNNALEKYNTRRYTDTVSLLYILGEKNLADLIRIHSRREFCFQIEAERCGAPILAALANNSRQAVQTFLRVQAENEPPTSSLRRLSEPYEQRKDKPTRFGRDFTLKRGKDILHELVDKDEEAVALAFVLSSHSHVESAGSSNSLDLELLSLAIRQRHEALAILLLERSAYVHQNSALLDELLRLAVNNGSEAIVNLLLDRGANIQPSLQGSQTPLSNAARGGHVAVAKFLLEKGADIESRNENGWTPLHEAAFTGKLAVVKLLLEKGADIESKDKNGWTPLHEAAFTGEVDVIKFLLEKGADIESKDKDGNTPLSQALVFGYDAVVKLLLEKGADIESKNNYATTPLHQATLRHSGHSRNYIFMKLLLEKGADVDSTDRNGRTPLSWTAATSEYRTTASLLIENGANIELSDNDGRTPLSWASGDRFGAATVSLLLGKGADVNSRDKNGRTPLSWASSIHAEDIITLLREAGADVESKETGVGKSRGSTSDAEANIQSQPHADIQS